MSIPAGRYRCRGQRFSADPAREGQNWYYNQIGKMNPEEIDAGNLTKCSMTEVLWRILSEERGLSNLHDCVLQELRILQEVYKDIHPSHTFTNGGFIQYLAIYPFKVHLFLDEQIELYLDEVKKGPIILHLDATSSIIKKIPGQNKHVSFITHY